MSVRYLIIFHDGSSRTISPEQAQKAKKAMLAGTKYVAVKDDLYAVSAIAQIKKRTVAQNAGKNYDKILQLEAPENPVTKKTIIAVTKSVKRLPCNTSEK